MSSDLFTMFYPLTEQQRLEWAGIVALPAAEFAARVAAKASAFGLRQESRKSTLCWLGPAGNLELMLFRVPDPGNLAAVRDVYDQLAENNCPLAYVFVNQRGDGVNTWDVFHLSPISYLAHCNRLSGPGAGCA